MASILDNVWRPIWLDGWDYGYGYGGRKTVSAAEESKPAQKPTSPEGEEKTGQQLSPSGGRGGSAWPMGFSAPLRASYSTYRRLLGEIPTIAFVRSVVFTDILSGSWTVEADEGIPDAAKKLIETAFVTQRDCILQHALKALDFGHAKFEVVWGIIEGQRVPVQFKPLSWQQTQIVMLEKTGKVIGLDQDDAKLRDLDWLLYTHDGEPGEPEGRSRLENVRAAGSKWIEIQIKIAQLIAKEAGSVVATVYPPDDAIAGGPRDGNGATTTNRVLGEQFAKNIASGAAYLAVPNALSVLTPEKRRNATIDQLTELLKLNLWDVKNVSLGGNGPALLAMQGYAAYLDTQMVRGYLRPERSVLEGAHGTKAEAGVHTDTGTNDSEWIESDIVKCLNRGPVDNTLEEYGGSQLRGKVRIVAQPLRDVQESIDAAVVHDMISGPLADYANSNYELGVTFERRGIPKRKVPLPMPTPQPLPNQPGGAPPNGNGAPVKGTNGKARKVAAAMSRAAELFGDGHAE